MPEPPQTRSARPFVPERATLPRLLPAAAGCAGCDLYRDATQTVFGEGAEDARAPDPETRARETEHFIADLRGVAGLLAEPQRARR